MLGCLRLFWVLVLVFAANAQPFSTALYDRLEWRNIGPFRAGRVIAVAAISGDPATYYFGAVGGGVWKSTNAGTTWTPIFDSQRISSIGAIAVAPSDPRVIYVGSGEADMRSQIGFGDGMYKSTDAGKSWRKIGLEDTRQIAKILIDPHDPNLVYIAALGHAYGPNAERGVFRSTDGGEHWKKVLDKGPEIGAADLAMDPSNSHLLFATMWHAHRPVWSQYPPIEGPGSGLFRSTDGGDTWTPLKGHGLPENPWHRSGVAVAAGGRTVYAVVDAPPGGGLYRSDDGGETWANTSSDQRIITRSWYFSNITIDPKNVDTVYLPNVALYRSTDGGKSFQAFKGAPGGDDYHILWIDAADTRHMFLGSDQGANVSLDGGATWGTWYNQPTAQMYHLITDQRFDYTVYGAQQDSGTAAVRSRTDHVTIDQRDWFPVGGAEAGYIAIDGKDPNILYVGDTYGALSRYDTRNGQSQDITPAPAPFDAKGNISTHKYRFPWTSPLVASPTEPGTLYYGAQKVLKTIDGGLHWQEISPDLTGDSRKDTSQAEPNPTTANARAAGFGVVYALRPSTLKAGLIWVGSDTGLIHVTQDGGKNWRNVTPTGLPDWSRVTQMEASHFDPAVAYASVDRHRLEDYKPYIYRTTDYGKTWSLVVAGLAEPAYVNSIKEDPARKGLLYAATELGMAVSFDDGEHWQTLQLNLPTVSVRDIEVHGDDVVIATFGRGFWILDNASLLRQIDTGVSFSESHLYRPATAVRMNPIAFAGTPLPLEEPQAKNPPSGAFVDFYLRSLPGGEVALEFLDEKGAVIRRFSSRDPLPPPNAPGAIADVWVDAPARLTPRAGMNRFVWDLRYPLPGGPGVAAGADDDDAPPQGPLVLPGSYQVRLLVEGRPYTQPLKVVLDPRATATTDDLAQQWSLAKSILDSMRQQTDAAADIGALRKKLEAARNAAQAANKGQVVGKILLLDHDAERIAASLTHVRSQLQLALGVAQSADRTPPATAFEMSAQAGTEMKTLLRDWARLSSDRLADLKKELAAAALPALQ